MCEYIIEYSRLVVIRDIWFGSVKAGLGRTGRVYPLPKPLPGVLGTYTHGTVGSNLYSVGSNFGSSIDNSLAVVQVE